MVADSLVLARRTVTKMLRNPEQFIDVTVQPIIMTVLFVFIFGGAVAGSTADYLQFADAASLDVAARALGEGTRDESAFTLSVPGDGGVRSLRGLLDRLDGAGVDVGSLSVHTPDLDDVFFALTTEKEAAR
jgi:hypothetical protein